MESEALVTPEYRALLEELKGRVQSARIRTAVAATQALILLYWDIGQAILARQAELGWGARVVDQLAHDLRETFPDMKGLSPRNLKYMRAFAEAYPDRAIVQQLVAQLPWGHILHLLHKVKDTAAREWYIKQTIKHGWSRNVLALHTAQDDYARKGKAVTNFSHTLPAPQSDLAQNILKDPYIFDFLGLADDTREREIENALLQHLREFLIELGNGFAFVGNQYRLEIADEDYYIDLLFYHLKLRCYFVIDLKARPFAAEDAGKMNFYLNAVDDLLRHPEDQPSVGLVLCRENEGSNRMLLEYALRGLKKPIGVSEYQLTRALPDDLKPSLPTVEEIEREIADTIIEDDDSAAGRLVREM